MSDAIPLPARPDLRYYKKLAKELLHADDVRAWLDGWITGGEARETIARLEKRLLKAKVAQLSHAQLFLARAHGFESWPKFSKHVEAMRDHDSRDALFEAAADAIVVGDLATLDGLLRKHPELVRARSSRAHGATLLHYAAANGVEDFRQKTPANIVAIARRLVGAGADVNAEAQSYGGGDTTFMLAATSVHPQRAGVQLDLMRFLLDHGAVIPPDAVYACLANGRGEAAEFLLDRGEVLDFSRGADANGMTLLHHAAAAGSLRITRMLLDRGAEVDAKNGYGGTVLEQAVWSAIHARRPQHIEIIELLVERDAHLSEEWLTGYSDIDAALHPEQRRVRDLRRVADQARHERRYDDARSGYLAAVDVCRASGDARLLAHTLRHLGDIEREMGRNDDAEVHLVEALEIARRERVEPLELANTIRPLALVRDDEALWREAHALYASVDVQAGVAEAARHLSRGAPLPPPAGRRRRRGGRG